MLTSRSRQRLAGRRAGPILPKRVRSHKRHLKVGCCRATASAACQALLAPWEWALDENNAVGVRIAVGGRLTRSAVRHSLPGKRQLRLNCKLFLGGLGTGRASAAVSLAAVSLAEVRLLNRGHDENISPPARPRAGRARNAKIMRPKQSPVSLLLESESVSSSLREPSSRGMHPAQAAQTNRGNGAQTLRPGACIDELPEN